MTRNNACITRGNISRQVAPGIASNQRAIHDSLVHQARGVQAMRQRGGTKAKGDTRTLFKIVGRPTAIRFLAMGAMRSVRGPCEIRLVTLRRDDLCVAFWQTYKSLF
jgi:hypothetical protein